MNNFTGDESSEESNNDPGSEIEQSPSYRKRRTRRVKTESK